MSNPYPQPGNPGGGHDGPPGQNLLCVCLALLAAVLGTPALFQLIGPVIKEMVYKAYDSRDLAMLMYFASFGLSGVVIFAICRMALWYAIAGVVAFGAVRFAGLAV
ncbi:hypothetical protein KAJ83_04485 [Marivibrio halodurans]|uniref:Uncharacterized protein n=1 Tax=Marivibrio halodurans TaxID=2039722 RepID=A0A8J7RXK1_9PROT|nr:hypothetical protein [Marivibrio halodurans]MBP5856255.1 hypothetical protein [Marivibrio halodurans]